MPYEARILGLDVADRDTWHPLPEAFVRKLVRRAGLGWERAHDVFAEGSALALPGCAVRRQKEGKSNG